MAPDLWLKPALTSISRDLLSAADYERRAAEFLPAATLAWLAGGSGDEQTLRANSAAYGRLQLQPRLLAPWPGGSTAINLLGQPLAHPLLLAPVAHQRLAHPDGELATAAGAAATDTTLVVSTLASTALEQIATASNGHKWFQLYLQPERAVSLDLLRRAEAAGYDALVLTLDTPLQPLSRRAQQAGFSVPASCRAVNLDPYPPPAPVTLATGQSAILNGLMARAPTLADLEWLLAQSRLPVLVKGVCRAEDARRLKAAGVAGLIVSNHGGRALDGTPASLELLPAVRQAVGPDYPLLVDGGIRSGYDLFKALACGANAALIGRPQLHALAVAGALGVAHLLKLLRDELELCMALCGCPTIAAITPDLLWPPCGQEY